MSVYGSFVRNIVMPNVRYAGIGFWDNYLLLERTQWNSREELERLQWKKLGEILEYSYENVPYYRRLFDSAKVSPGEIKKPEDIKKIPVSTKDNLKKTFPAETVSKRIPGEKLIPNATSGSTGTPFAFYIDKQLIEMERAHLQRGYSWSGLSFGERFVTLWGPHNITLKDRVFMTVKRRRMLSAFEMNDENMKTYVEKIRAYKPVIIEAYVSAVYGLSRYMIENNETLSVESILTSAETLSDMQRKIIEQAFDCRVFDRYGSREFGTVAQECEEHAGLHVGSESFFVEFVDDDGEEVSPGEQGRLVVTCFENHAMPFIRYDTGDLATLSVDKCNCGRELPMIEKVSGRIIDLVKTPSGKIISVHYLTLLFEDYSEYFRNFQAIQRRKNLLEVLIEPTKKLKPDIEEEVAEKLRKHAGDDMNVKITKVDEIPLTKAGKRMLLRSEVK